MNDIHPSAVIDPKAELEGVTVGPLCVVGAGVRIARGTRLVSQVYIEGDTEIDEDNIIYPFVSIGAPPERMIHSDAPGRVRIGKKNQLRESVTVHRGSAESETRIGNHCLLMAYVHVSHDCRLGNFVCLINGVQLAGHVEVDDLATISAMTGVHQYCRIGARAFIGACSALLLDAPPFCVAEGRRAEIIGVNQTSLSRSGFDKERIAAIRRAYKTYFTTGTSKDERLAAIERDATPDVQLFADFVRASKRGVMFPR